MTNYVFEKNRRAIKYGNHASNIETEYCTHCDENLALCDYHQFGNTEAPPSCASLRPHDCPHMRAVHEPAAPVFKIGDHVTTIHADEKQSMGPAEIVMMVTHKDQPYVLCRWLKYDQRDTPCYRPVAVADLVHWVMKPEQVETPVSPLQSLRIELNRVQKLIDILLSERTDSDKP